MEKAIQDIFENYDYGYDLSYVAADDWQKEKNRYFRLVYLENNEKFGPPMKACFNVYMHEDGRIKSVIVDVLQ